MPFCRYTSSVFFCLLISWLFNSGFNGVVKMSAELQALNQLLREVDLEQFASKILEELQVGHIDALSLYNVLLI